MVLMNLLMLKLWVLTKWLTLLLQNILMLLMPCKILVLLLLLLVVMIRQNLRMLPLLPVLNIMMMKLMLALKGDISESQGWVVVSDVERHTVGEFSDVLGDREAGLVPPWQWPPSGLNRSLMEGFIRMD